MLLTVEHLASLLWIPRSTNSYLLKTKNEEGKQYSSVSKAGLYNVKDRRCRSQQELKYTLNSPLSMAACVVAKELVAKDIISYLMFSRYALHEI